VGKKSSKTKTTTAPPKWAVPHLQGAMGTISNTVGANQGNLDAAAGQIRGFLPGLGEQAFGQNAGLGAATNYGMDVIGGKYLDEGNPYMNQMASMARQNVAGDINSMFSKAGRAGSDSHYQDLARGMGEAELGLRYQNYGNERNAQTQAAGMMPALNQSQYAGIMPYLAAQQTAAGLPFTGLQSLGMIGGLTGGGGTQTGTQPGGWGSGLLGAAAMALPFIPGISAREAKTKIERIGEWDGRGDGLGKYRFAYKWEPDTMLEGVMADEVSKLRPSALGPIIRGYQSVNYAMLEAA
jgi:hypothetical protein